MANSGARTMIRPYEPRDRDAVRRISYDTADAGASGAGISSDREFIEDLLTAYYTDYEPESLFVLEADGKVVGYLEGCLDTRRQLRITMRRILPRAAIRALARGAIFHADIWRLAGSAFRTILAAGTHRGADLDQYPAHLHVNILDGYRGRKAGNDLMERFFDRARAAGVHGVHLSVREDNAPARRFFENAGFTAMSRQPTIATPRASGILYSITYGKIL